MSPSEAEMWNEANARLARGGHKAASPCSDCTTAFALTMLAQDACNGAPGGKPKAPPARIGRPVVSSGDPDTDYRRRRLAAAASRRYRARKGVAA